MRRSDRKRLRQICGSACNTQYSEYCKCVLVVRAKDFREVRAMFNNNLFPEKIVCVQGWIGMPPNVNMYLMELEAWRRTEFEFTHYPPCRDEEPFVRKIGEAWRAGYNNEEV